MSPEHPISSLFGPSEAHATPTDSYHSKKQHLIIRPSYEEAAAARGFCPSIRVGTIRLHSRLGGFFEGPILTFCFSPNSVETLWVGSTSGVRRIVRPFCRVVVFSMWISRDTSGLFSEDHCIYLYLKQPEAGYYIQTHIQYTARTCIHCYAQQYSDPNLTFRSSSCCYLGFYPSRL